MHRTNQYNNTIPSPTILMEHQPTKLIFTNEPGSQLLLPWKKKYKTINAEKLEMSSTFEPLSLMNEKQSNHPPDTKHKNLLNLHQCGEGQGNQEYVWE